LMTRNPLSGAARIASSRRWWPSYTAGVARGSDVGTQKRLRGFLSAVVSLDEGDLSDVRPEVRGVAVKPWLPPLSRVAATDTSASESRSIQEGRPARPSGVAGRG
jgi:hypothetical protein